MSQEDEKIENEEDKENLDESRAETSMSESTFMSSGRIHNEKAEVNEEGVLDLANRSLTNLDRSFSSEYAKVTKLIISGNCIQKFTYMKMFPKCEILDGRDCQINKFVADFNYNLKELYLSGNQLKEISQLNRFESLKILNVSDNQIEENVILSLKNLEVLNMSGNCLSQLPDLSKCASLHEINLSGNKINDITMIGDLLNNTNLKKLDISSNSIDDLSQFSLLSAFKKLEELAIADNPCISEVTEENNFDYRSYIFACCSEALRTIDNTIIEDHIQTEGEWLAIQGGIKKIGPGHHRELCDRIASHFPKADSAPPTPAQKSCHKALEKRRTISNVPSVSEQKPSAHSPGSTSDQTVNSIYSPFREWNGKMTIGSNLRMCSPPEARKNRSFTFQNESSSASTTNPSSPQRVTHSSRTNSTDTVVLSRDGAFSSLEDRSEETPLPSLEQKMSTLMARRTPTVDDVSFAVEVKDEDLRRKIGMLEAKINELSKQNELLSATNDVLVETMELFKAEQEKMWRALRSSIPSPQNLSNSFVKEDEDGRQIHTVKWEMPTVKAYKVYVDDEVCGEIIGKNNSARITDLDPTKSHCVQIQSIGINGMHGEMSKKLYINPK